MDEAAGVGAEMLASNETYVIEKGVPIPKSGRGANQRGRSKYPFAQMDVGDSFPAKKHYSTLKASARLFVRAGGGKGRAYIVRRTGDGCRVWRVK